MSVNGVSSGGVVFHGGSVLIVEYREGGWVFPKGHVEAGETLEVAAVREILEETGVSAEIVGPLGETAYINRRGIARQVQWYHMRALNSTVKLETTFKAGGFFPVDEAETRLTYAQDRDLLKQALSVNP